MATKAVPHTFFFFVAVNSVLVCNGAVVEATVNDHPQIYVN